MSKILALIALCSIPFFAYATTFLHSYKIVCHIHDHGGGMYFVDVVTPRYFDKFGFALVNRLDNGKRIFYPLSPYVTNFVKKDSYKIHHVKFFSKKNGGKRKNGETKMEKQL